jgi:hypothetical protein
MGALDSSHVVRSTPRRELDGAQSVDSMHVHRLKTRSARYRK